MPPLYLTEQGAVLRKEGNRFTVTKDEMTLLTVPSFKVDAVMVFGHVQITTQAIAFLLENGIDTSFFTIAGRLKGKLAAIESKNVLLRVRQFERAKEERFCFTMAQQIVQAKLANARAVLMRHARNHQEIDLKTEIDELGALVRRVMTEADISIVRGLEGHGSALYFRAFAQMLRAELGFDGRNRRPPTDPVNGMLSLGYVLLTHELAGLVAAHSFDPYVGFYHDLRYGRVSLALDLVEEFRHPVVDSFVLWLANKRVMQPDDFTRQEDGGVMLKPEPFKRFLRSYEERMQRSVHMRTPNSDTGEDKKITWRDIFRSQVQQLVHAVQSGEPYQPFFAEG